MFERKDAAERQRNKHWAWQDDSGLESDRECSEEIRVISEPEG